MDEHDEGFYHVRSKITGMPSIAQLDEGVWWMIGCDEQLNEFDFTHIGPKIERPGHPINKTA